MALLFIVTVLSLTGTMVNSANDETSCDAPLSNTACKQGSCQASPCTMLCGLTTPYKHCEQNCDASSCNSMKCNASDRCLQSCSNGNCTSMTCDGKSCYQTCNRGNCDAMTCVKNTKSDSFCEQTSITAQMICESETCNQNCNNGKCIMRCLSSVKRCTQNCDGGNCQYKCEAQDDCTLNCKGDSCTKIQPSTTKILPTTTPTSSAYCLQMSASAGLALMFAVHTFM